jgi:hypothetical protein
MLDPLFPHLFGLHLGKMVPVATLILHLIWGAALGLVFRWLGRKGEATPENRAAA